MSYLLGNSCLALSVRLWVNTQGLLESLHMGTTAFSDWNRKVSSCKVCEAKLQNSVRQNAYFLKKIFLIIMDTQSLSIFIGYVRYFDTGIPCGLIQSG